MVTCLPLHLCLQVSGVGNCMYASIKKGLGVCLAMERRFPYYPMRYFRHKVVNWLVTNRQKVMLVKGDYIRQAYGIGDEDAQFTYKQYCKNVLDKRFWGDALILYAVSCMWAVKITVVNSKTLQQYKVRHTASLRDADIALVYNSSFHYTAAGEYLASLVKKQVACYIVLWLNFGRLFTSLDGYHCVFLLYLLQSLVVTCH